MAFLFAFPSLFYVCVRKSLVFNPRKEKFFSLSAWARSNFILGNFNINRGGVGHSEIKFKLKKYFRKMYMLENKWDTILLHQLLLSGALCNEIRSSNHTQQQQHHKFSVNDEDNKQNYTNFIACLWFLCRCWTHSSEATESIATLLCLKAVEMSSVVLNFAAEFSRNLRNS